MSDDTKPTSPLQPRPSLANITEPDGNCPKPAETLAPQAFKDSQNLQEQPQKELSRQRSLNTKIRTNFGYVPGDRHIRQIIQQVKNNEQYSLPDAPFQDLSQIQIGQRSLKKPIFVAQTVAAEHPPSPPSVSQSVLKPESPFLTPILPKMAPASIPPEGIPQATVEKSIISASLSEMGSKIEKLTNGLIHVHKTLEEMAQFQLKFMKQPAKSRADPPNSKTPINQPDTPSYLASQQGKFGTFGDSQNSGLSNFCNGVGGLTSQATLKALLPGLAVQDSSNKDECPQNDKDEKDADSVLSFNSMVDLAAMVTPNASPESCLKLFNADFSLMFDYSKFTQARLRGPLESSLGSCLPDPFEELPEEESFERAGLNDLPFEILPRRSKLVLVELSKAQAREPTLESSVDRLFNVILNTIYCRFKHFNKEVSNCPRRTVALKCFDFYFEDLAKGLPETDDKSRLYTLLKALKSSFQIRGFRVSDIGLLAASPRFLTELVEVMSWFRRHLASFVKRNFVRFLKNLENYVGWRRMAQVSESSAIQEYFRMCLSGLIKGPKLPWTFDLYNRAAKHLTEKVAAVVEAIKASGLARPPVVAK